MDDSDQDFTDLFGRLLKRVRKKGVGAGESGEEGKRGEESQPLTRTKDRAKRGYPKNSVCSKRQQSSQKATETSARRTQDSDSASQTVYKETAVTQETTAVMATTQTNGTQPAAGEAAPLGVKEKVVRRMQQFKRTDPQRLKLTGSEELRDAEPQRLKLTGSEELRDAEPQRLKLTGSEELRDAEPQENTPSLPVAQAFPPTSASEPTPGSPGDEALAIRLQQELNTEALVNTIDLDLGGLFFCQICQRDLSNMSPMSRAQHINRCLDQSEGSAPPKPAPPRVPDCPICGKGFKSQKSRGSHLKRCAADMGVGPALLMEVLQRQAAEGPGSSAAGQQAQVGGSKRKGSAEADRPAKKKPRKKPPAPDEDTLVAMALSRSMMEREKEKEAELAAPTLGLQRRPDRGVGKRRGKKGLPAPPPLLLIQDPQAALTRLQDRIAALLLRIESPAPPTPDLPASTLPAWTGAAPLWQRSTLLDGGPTSILDFYTPALRPLIEPWVPSVEQGNPDVMPPAQCRSVSLAEPMVVAGDSPCPAEKHLDPSDGPVPSPALSADPSSSLSGLPVGSQTLRDVMDLAEEGMTLTQCGGTSERAYDKDVVGDFKLSGFVPETEREITESKVALSRLSADLASMVNNPQLSDVQLQVDCGDVFFAHSFMLYARCPMLIEMVHDSGFGVREEGLPQAQRVLLGEVPAKAVLELLHYIYTGHCPLTPELVPHVQELAVRFSMTELEELCLQNVGLADDRGAVLQQLVQNGGEKDTIHDEQNFLELLRSMWEDEENEEDSKEGGASMRGCGEYRMEGAGSPLLGGGELGEERVDEDELNEIYEFAAIQKRIQSSMQAGEESAEDDDEEAGRVKVCKEEEEDRENGEKGDEISQEESREKVEQSEKQFDVDPGLGNGMMIIDQPEAIQPHKSPGAETSLDKSYNRLFSQAWGEYVEPSPGPFSCHSHRGVGGAGQPGLLVGRASSRLQHGEVSRLPCFDSQEAIIDLSISPPPDPCSMFPVIDHSMGSVEYKEKEELDISGSFSTEDPRDDVIHSSKEVSCKDYVIRVANSSGPVASSGCREQRITPEVIVLSDSGDEMDVDPKNVDVKTHVVQNQQTPLVSENQSGDIDNPGVEPGEPEKPSQSASKAETLQAPANGSHMDSFVDSSWLVPGTPVCPMKVTRTSSTQTHNSMFRTQLFPRSLDNKARSSLSPSPTSASIPVTSVTPKHNGMFRQPDGIKHCSTASLGISGKLVSSSFQSPNRKNSGLNKEENLKNGNMVTVDVSQTEDLIRPDGRSAESSHAQPGLRRRTSSCTGIEWTSVPPAASSTPLALCSGAVRFSVLHSDSEHSSGTIQSSVAKRTGSADESSAETPQGDSPGSLHLSLVATSPSTQRDCDLGLNPRESPGNRSSRESDCLQSPGNGNLSEREENLFEEPEDGLLPGQTSCAMDEPPMPFDDSWGMGARFSLRVDSSTGTGPLEPDQGDAGTGRISPPAPPVDHATQTPSKLSSSMLNSKIWDDWEEDGELVELPLSQTVCPMAPAKTVTQLKTPVATCRKNQPPLEPFTPMPGYSDMETPELKNRLNKFGVRPLPKRQMVLKLKEIYQYTHQLLSSDSEEEVFGQHQDPSAAHLKQHPKPASASGSRDFKQPVGMAVKACAEVPALRPDGHEDGDLDREPLSASQASTASSTAASEDSERSNPELCPLSDDDSDSDEVTPSQAVSRSAVKLQAVRHLLQSDTELYGQILQYQPLVLSQLQARLKEAGIRLGATKLLDFLDSQCITFTTANPAKASLPRGRGKGRGRGRRLKGTVKTSA
ncbi:structure-specific endonuclease subunit SLX4 isoform X2 [Brienomyrus brachyistius]|uniref:structure-specific endonuclease subunit SLX4 isoform X2 n=1 Tax=Brienomyrus brachyistius TaxID=42636 RepID=UPI0020B19BC1|nr:structure-specific endonuclease subunit SLX4 isoform X2 [Brienomyrus brachyistius]